MLGVPLLTERMWFFSSYWPRLESLSRNVTFTSNDQTERFDQRAKAHFATGRLSTQFGDQLRATGVINFSPHTEDGRLPAQNGRGDAEAPYGDLGLRTFSTSASEQADYLVSTATNVSLRVNHFRFNAYDVGVPDEIAYAFFGSNAGLPDVPEALSRPNGFRNIFSNTSWQKSLRTRTSLHVTGTHFRELFGEHLLKAGFQLTHSGVDLEVGSQKPSVYLFWDQSRTAGDGQQLRGTYGYYSAWEVHARGDVGANQLGLFLQDSWTLANRLILDLGVRFESESIPSLAEGAAPPIEFGLGDKIAPRLGFSLDAIGDGQWKVYGSWGLFYDSIKLQMPQRVFGGERYVEDAYTLDTLDWTSIAVGGQFPGRLIDHYESQTRLEDPNDFRIDPELEPMRTRELTLGVDRALGPHTVAAARYVRKRLDRSVEDVGILTADGVRSFIANPGLRIAETLRGRSFPALPEARREYDGLEFRLDRQLSRRFMLRTSYLWRRIGGCISRLERIGGCISRLEKDRRLYLAT